METVRLSRTEFNDLREYSCSFPTGTTLGKRWKCNRTAYQSRKVAFLDFFSGDPVFEREPPDWWMGEYTVHQDPKRVMVVWRKIEVV